ncbi:MAG: transposase [Sulfuritalea sp.]|nr:transposase [Sulfuritalea sp.]
MITAHVTQAPNDKREIAPVLDEVQALPQASGASRPCWPTRATSSRANVQACLGHEIEPMLSMKRESPTTHQCLSASLRTRPRLKTDDPVLQMAHLLGTKTGRALYGLRSEPEAVFGIIKRVVGRRQMSMRGLDQGARRMVAGERWPGTSSGCMCCARREEQGVKCRPNAPI